MEVITIPIEKIIVDVQPRINSDIDELTNNIKKNGLLEPLMVEGPDLDGNYYLIHGVRRYEALKVLKKTDNKYEKVQCIKKGSVTTREKREALRLLLAVPGKKQNKTEFQIMFNNTDPELISDSIPKHKVRKIEKGMEIPEHERIKCAKKRASQEALCMLYKLACDGQFMEYLKEKLWQRKINVEHATAFKKLMNCKYYKDINNRQKRLIIEKTLKQARFEQKDGDIIVIGQLMQDDPRPEMADWWINYVCDEISKNLKLVHTNLRTMVSVNSIQVVHNLIIEFFSTFGWAYNPEGHTEDVAGFEGYKKSSTNCKKTQSKPIIEYDRNQIKFIFDQNLEL
jgi:hypothetical protein